jgi:hypothetical protein
VRVEVIVPYAGDCPHRAAALTWTISRSPYRVTIARGRAGEWCKAEAVNSIVAASTADVIAIVDADVYTDGIPAAVQAVADGAPWAIPHRLVCRLTQDTTRRLIRGEPLVQTRMRHGLNEPAYVGIAGGGAIVSTPATLRDVPLDPRFVGWGQEDVALGIALRTLTGQEWRGHADLIHLWHPPQPRINRKVGSVAGQSLCRRYLAARRDPDRMRALIQEAHECSPTC